MLINEFKVENDESTTDRVIMNIVSNQYNEYNLKVQRRNDDSTTDRMKYEMR